MIAKLLSSKNWLPYFKPLARAFNDNDPAILLSELANLFEYHDARGELTDDGYFYATADKLEEETCLSQYKQSQAIAKLESAGLVETTLRGIPARKHFRFPNDFENKFSNFLKTDYEKTSKQAIENFEDIYNENQRRKPKKKLKVVSVETTPENVKLKQRLNCQNGKHESAVIAIVDYFRQSTGREVEYHTKGALKYMLHWLNEGYTVDDFKKVIDYKTRQFKGTENAKFIALDTYCRFDKFEDTLSKAKNEVIAPAQDPTLNDCQLTPEQQEQYNETKKYIYGTYPNLKEIRFFSHREFLLVSTNDNNEFLPTYWRNKATERNMKQHKKNAMDRLNTNHFERKAAGSLYDYLKNFIRAELKKDN